VGRWIGNGEIPADVLLHHIVQTWAVERAEFDARWVIPNYSYVVHGVEDGRPEKVIREVDLNDEPRRMKVDRLASRIPILSKHRPQYAQLIAYTRHAFRPMEYARRSVK
jgi:hypothetical protein